MMNLSLFVSNVLFVSFDFCHVVWSWPNCSVVWWLLMNMLTVCVCIFDLYVFLVCFCVLHV